MAHGYLPRVSVWIVGQCQLRWPGRVASGADERVGFEFITVDDGPRRAIEAAIAGQGNTFRYSDVGFFFLEPDAYGAVDPGLGINEDDLSGLSLGQSCQEFIESGNRIVALGYDVFVPGSSTDRSKLIGLSAVDFSVALKPGLAQVQVLLVGLCTARMSPYYHRQ